jgi:hypothetical protein
MPIISVNVPNVSSTMSKSKKRRLRQKKRTVVLSANVATPKPRSTKRSRGARRSGRRNGRRGSPSINPANFYLHSLLDPERGAGAKVPDLVGFRTGTVQLTYDSTLTTAASTGDTVAIAVLPLLGNGSSIFPIQTAASATPGAIAAPTNINWTQQNALASQTDTIRPVSAILKAEFIGPSTADGGQITGMLLGRNTVVNFGTPGVLNIAGGPNAITTFGIAMSQYGSVTVPLRDGMCVRWKPQDNQDLEFFDNTRYPSSPNGDLPTMLIVATGLPSGVTYIRVRVCVNFELVPNSDTMTLIDASPSPVIPQLIDEALNVLAEEQFSAGPMTNYANLGLTGIGTLGGYASMAYNAYRVGRSFLQAPSSSPGAHIPNAIPRARLSNYGLYT